MGTKTEVFISERESYWKKTHKISKKILKKGYKSLTKEEALDFPNLYRKICTDYEIAKTLELSPDTQHYIYKLVQSAHNILYATPRGTFPKFVLFFTKAVPASFVNNWKPIFVIFLLFFTITLFTGIITFIKPSLATYLLSDSTIEWVKDAYQSEVERSMADNIRMYAFYISNNITISFMVFALGVTFGLGTILLIIYNGISIGAIAGIVINSGYGHNFFSFVTAHAAFELLGICLSGGAGLALGLSMIFATEERRMVAFNKKAKELVPVIFVAAFFIFLAAMIEGFVSPLNIPYVIKLVICIISVFFIILYMYKVIFIRYYRRFLHKKHMRNKYKIRKLDGN